VAEPSDESRKLIALIRSLRQALERIETPACDAAASALATAATEIAAAGPGADLLVVADQLPAARAGRAQDPAEGVLDVRNRQFRDILSACPLGVAVISRRGWKRLFINHYLVDMFKAPSMEAFQRQDLIDSWVDKAEFARAARNIAADVDHVDFEAMRRCFDGSMIWVLMNSLPIVFEGQPARVFWHIDITERKRMEDELRLLATTDVLTGVANRRHFLATVDREVERQRRYGPPCGLLMLDIDHFKSVNDSFGHACGDQVLRHVARLCLENIRGIDTLGRMGGEEFAVVVPETDDAGVLRLAERLRLAVAGSVLDAETGASVRVTLSVGATLHRLHDDAVEVTFARADKALYEAKHAGRNRVIFY